MRNRDRQAAVPKVLILLWALLSPTGIQASILTTTYSNTFRGGGSLGDENLATLPIIPWTSRQINRSELGVTVSASAGFGLTSRLTASPGSVNAAVTTSMNFSYPDRAFGGAVVALQTTVDRRFGFVTSSPNLGLSVDFDYEYSAAVRAFGSTVLNRSSGGRRSQELLGAALLPPGLRVAGREKLPSLPTFPYTFADSTQLVSATIDARAFSASGQQTDRPSWLPPWFPWSNVATARGERNLVDARFHALNAITTALGLPPLSIRTADLEATLIDASVGARFGIYGKYTLHKPQVAVHLEARTPGGSLPARTYDFLAGEPMMIDIPRWGEIDPATGRPKTRGFLELTPTFSVVPPRFDVELGLTSGPTAELKLLRFYYDLPGPINLNLGPLLQLTYAPPFDSPLYRKSLNLSGFDSWKGASFHISDVPEPACELLVGLGLAVIALTRHITSKRVRP
jgi:hypothetical protein